MFRPARRARGKRPRSRRLCRLSIYTDTLGVQAWSVRAKTVEKTVCVNVVIMYFGTSVQWWPSVCKVASNVSMEHRLQYYVTPASQLC
jgi:hypothetical protein